MPKLDGISLVRALRAGGSRIRVMMVSGSLMERDLPADLVHEIAVAIPKPARMCELINGVACALRAQAGEPAKESIAAIFHTATRNTLQ